MGFYYDDQLNNDDYTVRLYGGGPNYDETNAIAKSIFTENFEFEIGNSWSNFEGGNFIEGLFNQIKPYAAYMDAPSKILQRMEKSGQFKGGKSKISRAINSAGSWLANNSDKMTDYLNKSIVVQGTRFVYFSGTSVDMGNLMMKYTVIHDPVTGSTVQDQLSKLVPYAIGDFKNMEDKGILSMIGWQDPPGGFKASYKNVDTQLEGTLKLKFGKMFEIDNLVIKSVSVSMSRTKVKDTDNNSLYADVTITFQLGGFITKNKLLQYTKIPNVTNSSK